jgi:hypothetical protein
LLPALSGTLKTHRRKSARHTPDTTLTNPQQDVYESLSALFRKLYFGFGEPGKSPVSDVLPALIRTAETVNKQSA